MNKQNKKAKKEVMAQVRAIQEILRRWDPMDLAPGEFAPADEYDSYAHQIVSLVAQGCSPEELTDHLQTLRLTMVCMRDKREGDADIAAEMIAALRDPHS